MATWRELRRGGALQIGQGVWAMPDEVVPGLVELEVAVPPLET
ncbi:Chromate resistance protein ChrB, partial [Mycolicibacterium mucogenicum]